MQSPRVTWSPVFPSRSDGPLFGVRCLRSDPLMVCQFVLSPRDESTGHTDKSEDPYPRLGADCLMVKRPEDDVWFAASLLFPRSRRAELALAESAPDEFDQACLRALEKLNPTLRAAADSLASVARGPLLEEPVRDPIVSAPLPVEEAPPPGVGGTASTLLSLRPDSKGTSLR